MAAFLLRVLDWVLRRLSLRRARAIGGALGLLWFHVVRIRRRTAIRQIRSSLGSSVSEARRIARETYRNLGRSTAEFLRVREAARTVRPVGWERYLAAKARGRGVVVVTGHFGNWDLLACSQALRGEPLHVVSKDLKDEGTNALWMQRRRDTGVKIHAATGSLRPLLGALRRGEVVAFVIDQDTPPEAGGILVPFFGRPAFTSPAPVVLARRTGAALLPVFLVRDSGAEGDGDGDGHEMQIGEEIRTEGARNGRLAIEDILGRCNAVLEDAIRAHPDHWLWLHRRWRSAEGAEPCGPGVVSVA